MKLRAKSPEHGREIERLFQLEFRDPAEVGVRIIGTLIAAIFIWMYVGWPSTWLWVGGYFSLILTYFFFLRSRLSHAGRLDILLAQVIFSLVLLSYVWMPALMISSSDDALSASGFCILACIIIFAVRRAEKYSVIMVIEIMAVAGTLMIATAFILVRYDNPLVWVGLIIAPTTMTFYLIQSAAILRRQRLRLDEISARQIQAEKMEAIGKLAGGVAHDFNNLLTVILGNIELISEVEDPHEKDQFLTEARVAALRGAEVVRQLLGYARKTDGLPKILHSAELMQTVEALCKTLLPSSIELRTVPSIKASYVCVDESLFVAAILNLIKNSVDAIESSGMISFTCFSRILEKPENFVGGEVLSSGRFEVFSVVDNGRGIPAENLGRVADPFFTTKDIGKGSGLGLSMVAGFAARAGGALQIDSSSKGTTVSVLLPAQHVARIF